MPQTKSSFCKIFTPAHGLITYFFFIFAEIWFSLGCSSWYIGGKTQRIGKIQRLFYWFKQSGGWQCGPSQKFNCQTWVNIFVLWKILFFISFMKKWVLIYVFFYSFWFDNFFYLFTFLFTFIFVLNSGVHIVMLVWLQVSEIGVLPQCGGKGTTLLWKNRLS